MVWEASTTVSDVRLVTVYLQIIENDRISRELPLRDRVEVGRRFPNEPLEHNDQRLVIADAHQTTVPRKWFQISDVGNGQIEVLNLHRAHSVFIEDIGGPIPPGDHRVAAVVPATTIRLMDGVRLRICDETQRNPYAQAPSDAHSGIRSLDASMLWDEGSSRGSGMHRVPPAQVAMRSISSTNAVDGAAIVSLVRKALNVVEAAAGSDGFLEAAVKAAVEIVGLDRAAILIPDLGSGSPTGTVEANPNSLSMSLMSGASTRLKVGDGRSPGLSSDGIMQWSSRAQYLNEHAQTGRLPNVSQSVLRRVVDLGTTQIYEADLSAMSVSLDSVSSVVAAPILDRDKTVAAVLYGDRWLAFEGADPRISELEALLLEVLAGAVAGGIARQQEEKSRANLSEFFSPRVASALVESPELLTGRDAEVSVLFCDVRGFSAISEAFGAHKTIEWINDVLTELSQCVVDSDGVLVDYVGDELLAMWGAPEHQPDHARRAFETSRNMLDAIERLRSRWDEQFGATLDVGIGINSGPALVGNVGSRLKFKYGVLGHTVNLGSRLQGACKHLGVRCVASLATIEAIGERQCARRLTNLRVAGIKGTVQVYECVARVTPEWERLRNEYEAALADFEAGQPGETVHRLGRLLQEFPNDRPCAFLLGRAARLLTEPGSEIDTVWELKSK